MKKVLIVDFNGTAPLYSFYLAKAFKNTNYKPFILGDKKHSFLKEIEQEYSVQFCGIRTKGKLLRYLCNWVFLLVKINSFDIVIVQWLQLIKYSSLEILLFNALQKRNSNVFYIIHNFYPHNCNNNVIKKRYDYLYSIAHKLLVHTESLKIFLNKKFPEKKIIKMDHGYFFNEFSKSVHKKNNQLLILGRISPYKGIEDAIAAVGLLINNGIRFKLVVAGKGDRQYVTALKNKIEKQGLEEHITIENKFIENSDLIAYHRKSFCVVLPYKNIQQSGVVFTAFGLGVPVVAYSVGGLKEVISDGRTGKLVELGNVEELAKAIKWTYDNHHFLSDNIENLNKVNLWELSSENIMANVR